MAGIVKNVRKPLYLKACPLALLCVAIVFSQNAVAQAQLNPVTNVPTSVPTPPPPDAPLSTTPVASSASASSAAAGNTTVVANTPAGGPLAAPAGTSTDAPPVLNEPQAGAGPVMPANAAGQAVSGSGGNDTQAFATLDQALDSHIAVKKPSVQPPDLKTLFFTAWQYALLNEAKQSFTTRPPTSSEINNPNAPRPTGPREISLGGISYVNGKSWTVWLNKERIKPDAIPKEVLDIRVSADHVDLKWFDNSTNLIYPIRLRPQERFNLDDRLFLPGAGT